MIANAEATEATGKTPISISLIALNDFHGNLLPPAGSALVPDVQHPGGLLAT